MYFTGTPPGDPSSYSSQSTRRERALMKNRYHVTYEDIRALYVPILRHRILLNFHAESDRLKQDDLLKQLLERKPAPRE